MPRALLVGAFGCGDPGLESTLDVFLSSLPEWDVIATSEDPAHTRATHRCDSIPLGRRAGTAKHALKADAVIATGGSILPPADRSAVGPDDLIQRTLVPGGVASATGRVFAIIGAGADSSTPRPRRLARVVARRADLVVLRSEEAATALTRMGVTPPFRVGEDPCWSVVDPTLGLAAATEGVLMILNHRIATQLPPPVLAEVVDASAASGIPVTLMPWQRSSSSKDLAYAAAIAAHARSGVETVEAPRDLSEAIEAARNYSCVFTMRLHGVAAGAAARTPVVAVSHRPEVGGEAGRLGQLVVSPSETVHGMVRSILKASELEPTSNEALNERVTASEESFRMLRVVLSHGRTKEVDDLSGLPLGPSSWRR